MISAIRRARARRGNVPGLASGAVVTSTSRSPLRASAGTTTASTASGRSVRGAAGA